MEAAQPGEPSPTPAVPPATARGLLSALTSAISYPFRLGPAGPAITAPGPAETASRRGPLRLNLAPFGRLALVQALSSAGDAMVAVAMAGSVFFNVKPTTAQSKVALSLALTVAPFAIVGPLLGPLVVRARAGRRAIVVGCAAGRAVCCFFMALWVHSLLLFPVTFFTLVFSKLYLVTKAALVPVTVDRPDQLVQANSKLSIGGSVTGTLAGSLAVGLLNLFGARGLLRFDIATYLICAWGAAQLAAARRAPEGPAVLPAVPELSNLAPTPSSRPGPQPRPGGSGLPPGGLQLAAVATGALRLSVGFVTFLLVFTFRRHGAALIWYGLALGASQLGNITGALVAPLLRRRAPEEWMLTASSVVVGGAALVAGVVHWGAHWAVATLLAAGIGLAAGSGKLAFDSMVQRDVPSRVRGRAFARFESGFQLAWAIGGLLAVLITMTLAQGFIAVGITGLVGAAAFAGGSVSARRGTLPAWFPGSAPRPVDRVPGKGARQS